MDQVLQLEDDAIHHPSGASMTKIAPLFALLLAFGLGHAQAASHAGAPKMDAASAPTAQQSKMKTCNTDAKDMKGDERKKFMSTCLKNKPETQQSKMKTCNVDAKDMKGDERKKFMSECLKKG
jgi:hypothetical protein